MFPRYLLDRRSQSLQLRPDQDGHCSRVVDPPARCTTLNPRRAVRHDPAFGRQRIDESDERRILFSGAYRIAIDLVVIFWYRQGVVNGLLQAAAYEDITNALLGLQ